MRPVEYLRLLRQRWWVLPITALLGFGIAFATEPAASKPIDIGPLLTYQATHVIVSRPIGTAINNSISYDRLAIVATSGVVPANTADTLTLGPPQVFQPPTDLRLGPLNPNTPGNPRGVTMDPTKVVVTPNTITGSVTITATAPSAKLAAATANALGAELIISLNPLLPLAFGDPPFSFQATLNNLQTERQTVFAARAKAKSDAFVGAAQGANVEQNKANLRQVQARLVDVDRRLLDLLSGTSSNSPIITLSPAKPTTETVLFPQLPQQAVVKSGWPRRLLGGGIGLGAGIALLLLAEVVRPRVRDVRAVEGAALMPVVAEISAVPIPKDERYRVIAAEEPSSLLAEAYRALRTSLLAMWPRHPVNTGRNGTGGDLGGTRPLRTLLVTSPGAGEGKSLSTVNLAAAFAETGASVIVLDADARRPTMHRYFGGRASPNLGDLDPDLTTADLDAVLQNTEIEGVRFAASARGTSPAQAVSVVKAAAVAAAQLADIVILDAPPLLVANDSAELAGAADATVLLVRAGRTRRDSAVRGAGVLRRIEAPVVGAVLIGVEHGALGGFYGYDGYYGGTYGSDNGRKRGWRSRRRSKKRAARMKAERASVAAGERQPQFIDLVEADRATPAREIDLTAEPGRAPAEGRSPRDPGSRPPDREPPGTSS